MSDDRMAAYLDERSVFVPEAGCKLWLGATVARGYGRVTFEKRKTYAHRLAYESEHGPIPDGLWVLHKCDTPCCINLRHLYLGTNADNCRDRAVRGRSSGEWNPRARLSESDVLEMRAMFAEGFQTSFIAKHFNMSMSATYDITRGKRWRHVHGG